ncbi:uncharacterized protein [Prorops nasuta]|uniref:uncharacterized protein n=1 Tax=Prorops nasuta TaxID=863751 RepID=UPI0034CFEAE1
MESIASSICVICLKKGYDLRFFTEDSLSKCKKILKTRQDYNLDFNNVYLPSSVKTQREGYHTLCYLKFTSLDKNYRDNLNKQIISEESNKKNDNDESATHMGDEVKINNLKLCIFCDKKSKLVNNQKYSLHMAKSNGILEKIIQYATSSNKVNMLDKVLNYKSSKRVIFYHSPCFASFQYTYTRSCPEGSKNLSQFQLRRVAHKNAYQEICSFVNENVIRKKKCFCLNFLTDMFIEQLKKEYDKLSQLQPCYLNLGSTLKRKLLVTYRKKIKMADLRNQTIVTPYNDVSLSNNDYNLLKDTDIV